MEENEVNKNEVEVVKVVKEEPKQETTTKNNDNKMYNILSYLGVLWLVSMLACPNKDDKDVKFHIGQGMLITGLIIIVNLINRLLIANIFVTRIWGIRTVSTLGINIMWILNLVPVVFAIIGIINAYKEEQKELPIIGKFVFYK